MKINNLLILLSLITFISCGTKKTEPQQNIKASINGHISGFDKPIAFYVGGAIHMLEPDKNGDFSYKGNSIEEGFYTLGLGMESRIEIYLKQGTNLNIDIDLDKLEGRDKKAVSISGENTAETQLLYELMVNRPSYQYNRVDYKEVYYPMVYKKEPAEYEAYQLDLLKKQKDLIKRFDSKHSIAPFFKEMYHLELLLNYHSAFKLYGRIAPAFNKGKKITVPEKFQNYFKDEIPQDDFNLYHKSSQYAMYVRDKYYSQMREKLSQYEYESLEYHKAKTAYLDTCTFPEIIKEDMWNGYTISYMRTRDMVVRGYLNEIIGKKVKDADALKRFEEYKTGENAYADGMPAPQFTLKDINGKEFSLSDFKGKLVMMDCWATWCAPCVKGLPKFKKLEEKYKGKDIVFLAISVDEDVEVWKKKVKSNKNNLFTGIQLNTSQNQNSFKEDLMVQGIPRYILIGKDGRLIKREAPRPGTDELYKLIDSNL